VNGNVCFFSLFSFLDLFSTPFFGEYVCPAGQGEDDAAKDQRAANKGDAIRQGEQEAGAAPEERRLQRKCFFVNRMYSFLFYIESC
jgi:hypothetical protein